MSPEDVERIAQIFAAQGFPYELPDLRSNNLLARRVITCGDELVAGAGARLTVEIFGWLDPAWSTPAFRFAALKLLHREMEIELREKGVQDAHAWIPQQIERSFGRRLEALGWRRPLWTDFNFPLQRRST